MGTFSLLKAPRPSSSPPSFGRTTRLPEDLALVAVSDFHFTYDDIIDVLPTPELDALTNPGKI